MSNKPLVKRDLLNFLRHCDLAAWSTLALGVMVTLIFLLPSPNKRLESVTCSATSAARNSQLETGGWYGALAVSGCVPWYLPPACTLTAPNQQVPGVSAQRTAVCCAPPHASAAPAEPNPSRSLISSPASPAWDPQGTGLEACCFREDAAPLRLSPQKQVMCLLHSFYGIDY